MILCFLFIYNYKHLHLSKVDFFIKFRLQKMAISLSSSIQRKSCVLGYKCEQFIEYSHNNFLLEKWVNQSMEDILSKLKFTTRKGKRSKSGLKKTKKRTPNQMEALHQAAANPVPDQIQNQTIKNRDKSLRTLESSQSKTKTNGNKMKNFLASLSSKRKKSKASSWIKTNKDRSHKEVMED